MTDALRARTRQPFLGVTFDVAPLNSVVEQLATRNADAPFAYLVTPNVDHIVRLHELRDDKARVRAAYEDALWCTCDSRILALLAQRQGLNLPVVPGSDLTAILLQDVVQPGDQIALVGGNHSTIAALRSLLPDVTILEHQPPMGLMQNAQAIEDAASFIVQAQARFTFIAVGSPQQELIAHAATKRADAIGIGLCIGAAIEFVVGEKKRAPRFIQALKLEWAFRLAAEPSRLWRRYLVTGPRIFRIARAAARQEREDAIAQSRREQ